MKRIIFIMILILCTSCSNSNNKGEDIQTPTQIEYGQDGIVEEKNDFVVRKISKNLADSYIAIIASLEKTYGNEYNYGLAYINEDDMPELVFDKGGYYTDFIMAVDGEISIFSGEKIENATMTGNESMGMFSYGISNRGEPMYYPKEGVITSTQARLKENDEVVEGGTTYFFINGTEFKQYDYSFEERIMPDEVNKRIDEINVNPECLTYVATMNAKEIIEHIKTLEKLYNVENDVKSLNYEIGNIKLPSRNLKFDFFGNAQNRNYCLIGIGNCNDEKIIIPEVHNGVKVTEIRERAFYNCESIKEVEIPSSVTTIGKETFGECNELTRIIIPESVTFLGKDVFKNCIKLTDIQVAEGNPTYKFSNGRLINKNTLEIIFETESIENMIMLYNGSEIINEPGVQTIYHLGETYAVDYAIRNDKYLKYKTTYYSYSNGKYQGESIGEFEEMDDPYPIVHNVSGISFSKKYDVLPRDFKISAEMPDGLNDLKECSNFGMKSIDLDGDSNMEHLICTSKEGTSNISLYNHKLENVANLVTFNGPYIFSTEDIECIDIDEDGIMEVVIEIPGYEWCNIDIIKYKNGKVYGETDLQRDFSA